MYLASKTDSETKNAKLVTNDNLQFLTTFQVYTCDPKAVDLPHKNSLNATVE